MLLLSQFTSYGDAVKELDSGVGIILHTLQTLKIDKDTLVIFSSDNGGALYAAVNGNNMITVVLTVVMIPGGSNAPFLCGKETTFEGGMREPTIAWWPGTIKPNQVNEY